jgi:hypothetical protein
MALTLFENTYLVNADNYLVGEPVWLVATTTEKEQALQQATRILEDSSWIGEAVSETQTLAWPRKELSYLDTSKNLVVSVAQGSVPKLLEKATAQLALHLVKYPAAQEVYNPSFDSIKIGPIELENTDVSNKTDKVPLIPLSVQRLLTPLISTGWPELAWWRSN